MKSFCRYAWLVPVGILLWLSAPAPRAQEPVSPANGATPAPPAADSGAPTDALMSKIGDGGALFYDGDLLSSIDQQSGGLQSFIVRQNVRLISDQMTVFCDKLEYDSKTDRMIAHPAFDKRVEIRYAGMRALCGLLEYYPGKGEAILRRRPSIFEKDAKGREMETSGHVITITVSKDRRVSIMIRSKKGDIEEVAIETPASLSVDTGSPSSGEIKTDLSSIRKGLATLQSRALDAEDLGDIKADLRAPDRERP